jgi:hypothetical protein
MASTNPADYVALRGGARRFRDLTTGETLSRRQYDKLFRLGPRGITSYEALAHSRARAGYAPLRRTKAAVGRVVERVAGGERMPAAARAEGISPVTVRRFNLTRGTLSYNRQTRRWEVWRAGRVSFFDVRGQLHREVPFDHAEISTLSAYGHALKAAKAGRPAALSTFAGVTVRDLYGNEYQLLTNLDAYLALEARTDYDPMDYFKSGEELVIGPTPSGAGGAAA